MKQNLKKDLRKRVVKYSVVAAGLVSIINYYYPFSLSYPRIGSDWVIVLWESRFFVFITAFLVFSIAFKLWQDSEEESQKIIRFAIGFTLLRYICMTLIVSVLVFFFLLYDPTGKYLLPPYSFFFQNLIAQYSYPYFLAILTGAGSGGLFFWLKKLSGGKLVNNTEVQTAFLLGLVLGLERGLIAILLTFFLAILIQLLDKVHKRIRLAKLMLVVFIFSMFFGKTIGDKIFGYN